MDLKTFIIRITICFILSILIGIERQYRHKVVGLRTNVLVCLGSFMFVSVSFHLLNDDITRIAAQVVSGIGFLGAGVILRNGDKIKGLNTAATLWCVAAIGVLCASGMEIEAVIGTFFILISNIVLRIFSQKIMSKIKSQENCVIDIKCNEKELINIKKAINKLVNKYNLIIKNFNKINYAKEEINIIIDIVAENTFCFDEIVNTITSEIDINSININHNKLISSDNEDSDDE